MAIDERSRKVWSRRERAMTLGRNASQHLEHSHNSDANQPNIQYVPYMPINREIKSNLIESKSLKEERIISVRHDCNVMYRDGCEQIRQRIFFLCPNGVRQCPAGGLM